MAKQTDICVVYHPDCAGKVHHLVKVLQLAEFDVTLIKHDEATSYLRSGPAKAVIFCLCGRLVFNDALENALFQNPNTPDVVLVRLEEAGLCGGLSALNNWSIVELTQGRGQSELNNWRQLFAQLSAIFERPGLTELVNLVGSGAAERSKWWLADYPADDIVAEITSRKGLTGGKLRFFRWRLRRLLLGGRSLISILALPSAVGCAVVLAAVLTISFLTSNQSEEFAGANSEQSAPELLPSTDPREEIVPASVLDQRPARAGELPQQSGSIQSAQPGMMAEQITAREFQDTLGNGGKAPVMVGMPSGEFKMGSPPSETGHVDNEAPQITITIERPFSVSKYEITESEFAAYLSATGAERTARCDVYENGRWREAERPVDTGRAGTLPAICVTWAEASDYAEWLSEETGAEYRLPSEAEWEFAARAGTQSAYHFGDDPNQGCPYMNGADRSAEREYPKLIGALCEDGFADLAPVGSLQANAFGLHDMHGNVWEWTQNNWTESHAPGAARKSTRVIKGGSWFSYPLWLRSANRNAWEAERARMDVGFRVARDTSPEGNR